MWLESPVDTSGARVSRWAGWRSQRPLRAEGSPAPGPGEVPPELGRRPLRVVQEPGSAGAGLEAGALGAGWAPGWVASLVLGLSGSLCSQESAWSLVSPGAGHLQGWREAWGHGETFWEPEATGVQGRWDTWRSRSPLAAGDPGTSRASGASGPPVLQPAGSAEEGSPGPGSPPGSGARCPLRPRGGSLSAPSRPRARDEGRGQLESLSHPPACSFSQVCANPSLGTLGTCNGIFECGWFLGERRRGMVNAKNF